MGQTLPSAICIITWPLHCGDLGNTVSVRPMFTAVYCSGVCETEIICNAFSPGISHAVVMC